MEFEEVTHTNIVILPKQNGPKLLWHFAKKTVALIRKKFWLVLLCTAAAFTGTFVFNEVRTPLYAARGEYEFEFRGLTEDALTEVAGLNEVAAADRILASLTAPAAMARLKNDAVLKAILKAELTETALPEKRFLDAVQVTYDSGKRHFVLQAVDANPALAQALVQRVAATYNDAQPQTGLLQEAALGLKKRRLDAFERFHNGTATFATPLATPAAKPVVSSVPLPATVTQPAPIAAAELTPASPSEFARRLTELNSQISAHSARIAILQKILTNPSSTGLASAGGAIRAAYQAISGAQARLQNAVANYQIPPGEKQKMENAVGLSQIRFIQLTRNGIAAAQTRKRELEAERTLLLAQSAGTVAATIAPPPAPSTAERVASRQGILGGLVLPTPPVETAAAAPIPQEPFFDESALNAATLLWQGLNTEGAAFPVRLAAVNEPVLPEFPVLPDKARNLILALLCGLAAGCILAAFVGFQDEAIVTPADIEREFLIPVLGLIAKAR